jgi:hypothetical protein
LPLVEVHGVQVADSRFEIDLPGGRRLRVLGRRMCQGTLNLLTYVLPAVPLRQWVLTLPFELRAPLAYERNLMGAVARIFADSVMGWRRARRSRVGQGQGG